MLLKLKNIGAIKEANIKLDGLTIIAGENDTGKSTIGKSLFAILKAKKALLPQKLDYNTKDSQYFKKVQSIFEKISKKQLLCEDSYIKFEDIEIDFLNNTAIRGQNTDADDLIFIESPLIFNFYETFKSIANANSILDFEIPYQYISWDLYLKLSQKSKNKNLNLSESFNLFIKNIIDGEFIHKENIGIDKWLFKRDKIEIEVENVATGIKQFGILQAISKQGYLSKNRIIVLDEPEVHLHPKWQLKMAKLIVKLSKEGIKVLVTSHSPYIIEALQRYSEKEDIKDKTNFYFAENGYIKLQENLEKIFEKLAEPMRVLKELKWKSLSN